MDVYILNGKEYNLTSFSPEDKDEWLKNNPEAKVKTADFQTPTPMGADVEENNAPDMGSSLVDGSSVSAPSRGSIISGVKPIKDFDGDPKAQKMSAKFNPDQLEFEDYSKFVKEKYVTEGRTPSGAKNELKRLEAIKLAQIEEDKIAYKVTNIPDSEIKAKTAEKYFDLDNRPTEYERGGIYDMGSGSYQPIGAEEYLRPQGKWEQYQSYLETGKIDYEIYEGENKEDNKLEIEKIYSNSRSELQNTTQQNLLKQVPDDVRKNINFYGEGEEFANEDAAVESLEKLSNSITESNDSVLKANEQYNLDVESFNSQIKNIDSQLKLINKQAPDGDVNLLTQEQKLEYNELINQYKSLQVEEQSKLFSTRYAEIVNKNEINQRAVIGYKDRLGYIENAALAKKNLTLDYSMEALVLQAAEESLIGSAVSISGTIQELGIEAIKAISGVPKELLNLQVDAFGEDVGSLGYEIRKTASFKSADNVTGAVKTVVGMLGGMAIENVRNGTVNYNRRLAKKRFDNLPEPLSVNDIGKNGVSFFDWAQESLANNSTTIAMALIPSTLAAKAGGSLVKGALVAQKAAKGGTFAARNTATQGLKAAYQKQKAFGVLGMRTSQSLFFTSEGGGKISEMNVAQFNSTKKLIELDAQLKNTSDSRIRSDIQSQIEETKQQRDYTLTQKAFTGFTYGTIATVAETLGTLSFVTGARSLASKIGKQEFKAEIYRTPYKFFWNTGKKTIAGLTPLVTKALPVELLEETLTEIGHNATDIIVLEEDKSLTEGLNADFFSNVALSTLALMAPQAGGNINNILKNEFRIKEDVLDDQQWVSELIQLQASIKSGKLNGKALVDARNKRLGLLETLALSDVQSIMKLNKLSPEQIQTAADYNRQLRELGKQANEIKNTGPEGKEALKQIQKQYDAISKARTDLLSTSKRMAREKGVGAIEMLGNQAINPSLNYYMGLYQLYDDAAMVLSPKGKQYIKIENIKDIFDSPELTELGLSKDDKDFLIGKFLSGSNAVNIDGHIIINEPRILEEIARSGTDAEARYAALAPLEELFHSYTASTKVKVNGKLKPEFETAVKEAMEQIDNKFKQGKIKEDEYNALISRFNKYEKDGVYNFEEVMAQINNAIALGVLERNDFGDMFGMRNFMNNMISDVLGDASWMMQLKNGNDVFKFLNNFQTNVENKRMVDTSPEDKVVSEQKTTQNKAEIAINNLVGPKDADGNYIMTKKQWDSGGIALAYKSLIEGETSSSFSFENIKAFEGLIMKGLYGTNVYNKSRESYIREVKDGLTGTLMRFNPEINNSLSGWINKQMGFRKGDALIKGKENQSDSLDKLRPDGSKIINEPVDTSNLQDDNMDDTDLIPESEIKQQAPQLVDQAIEDNVETAVLEVAESVYPDIDSKEFAPFIQEVLEGKLTSIFQTKFGIGTEYKDFINKIVPVLKKAMPVKFFVNIESAIKPKDRQFTEPPVRLTKQADIDKARENDQINYVANEAQGVNLYKLKKFTDQQLVDFYIGKNVAPSTKGTRKTSLAQATLLELGKDMIPSVFTQTESDADLAKISNKIRRDSRMSFQEGTGITALNIEDKGIFYQNFQKFTDSIPPGSIDFRDEDAKQLVKEKLQETYGKKFPQLTNIAGNLTRYLKQYSELTENHKNLNTLPKESLYDFLYDRVVALETDKNIIKLLELTKKVKNIKTGKTKVVDVKMTELFDLIENINRQRSIPLELGKKLIKDGVTPLEVLRVMVFLKGMYASATQISRRQFTVKNGEVVAVIGKRISDPRYQVFENVKDWNNNVVKKIPGLENIKLSPKAGKVVSNQKVGGKQINEILFDETSKAAMEDKNYKGRLAQAVEARDIIKTVLSYVVSKINNNKSSITKIDLAMVLASMKSNMQGPLKRAANLAYIYEGKKLPIADLRYEHMIPTNYILLKLADIYLNKNGNVNELNKLFKGYTVAVIPEVMDTQLEGFGFKAVMPIDYLDGQGSYKRYYNIKSFGALNIFAIKSLNPIDNGKVFGETWATASKVANALKKFNNNKLPKNFRLSPDMTNKQVLEEMKKLDEKASKARFEFSEGQDLGKDFNEIIERATGIGREKQYGKTKARAVGATKSRWDWAGIPPSAQDFVGLTRYFAGKGKEGDATIAWVKKNFLDQFARANIDISNAQVSLANDFKALKKLLTIKSKDLNKKIVGEPYTVSNAIRVYTWAKQGMKIPGLSKADEKILNDYVLADENLQLFADELITINKTNGYPKPQDGWLAGTITTDLLSGLNTVVRSKYLEQWQNNVNEVFTEANLNKLEAAYGEGYRDALENILGRMKTGSNRGFKGDTLTGRFLDWINGSVGTIMFFNMRSAVLQTISAVNFVNWNDNNPLKAAAAFANQPQYWRDVVRLMNSNYLVQRRNGLKINVNEADIAEIAAESQNKAKAFINKLLKLGFLPTQIADSFAISTGGATFYRNRFKSYVKQGMSEKEAEAQAFLDFREIAEESQQSSRPDRISKQQAGPIGRIVLAFANTPAQYARLMQKAASDLKNRRGDDKTNISKIIYYGAIQNVMFNALQQALFAMAFDDEDDEKNEEKLQEKKNNKYIGIVNGMADSLLRGVGFHGAAISTLKNVIIKLAQGAKAKDAAIEMLDISPPVSSKVGKLISAGRTWDWNKKEIMEKGFSLDNPAWLASGQVVSAATNIPLDRGIRKLQNLKDASDAENEEWMRVANTLGWAKWELEWKQREKGKGGTRIKSSSSRSRSSRSSSSRSKSSRK